MIQFQCPHCGGKVRVPDPFAGKKGRCPKCNEVMSIPATSSSDTKAAAEAPAVKEEPASPEGALDSLAQLAQAAEQTDRPEVPPGTVVGAKPPDDTAVEEPPAFVKRARRQAAEPAPPAREKKARPAKPLKPAREVAEGEAAPGGLLKVFCWALYGLFFLALVLWTAVVVLTALRAAFPDAQLPDQRLLSALTFVAGGVAMLGGVLYLVILPLRWSAMAALATRHRMMGHVGGLGLVALLLTILAACMAGILAQNPELVL